MTISTSSSGSSNACRLSTSSLHCSGSRETMQRLRREGFMSLPSQGNLDALVARDHANPKIDGRQVARRQRAPVRAVIRIEIHSNVLHGPGRHPPPQHPLPLPPPPPPPIPHSP